MQIRLKQLKVLLGLMNEQALGAPTELRGSILPVAAQGVLQETRELGVAVLHVRHLPVRPAECADDVAERKLKASS